MLYLEHDFWPGQIIRLAHWPAAVPDATSANLIIRSELLSLVLRVALMFFTRVEEGHLRMKGLRAPGHDLIPENGVHSQYISVLGSSKAPLRGSNRIAAVPVRIHARV